MNLKAPAEKARATTARTAEHVNQGHPDKACDQFADSISDGAGDQSIMVGFSTNQTKCGLPPVWHNHQLSIQDCRLIWSTDLRTRNRAAGEFAQVAVVHMSRGFTSAVNSEIPL